jgi:hypothetical protein
MCVQVRSIFDIIEFMCACVHDMYTYEQVVRAISQMGPRIESMHLDGEKKICCMLKMTDL